MQSPRPPGGLWGSLVTGLLRWMVYGMLLSVMILVGSAVLRRAAATQNATANGMSGIAAAPSMPGAGNAASYAPKEYVKVGKISVQSMSLFHAHGRPDRSADPRSCPA